MAYGPMDGWLRLAARRDKGLAKMNSLGGATFDTRISSFGDNGFHRGLSGLGLHGL